MPIHRLQSSIRSVLIGFQRIYKLKWKTGDGKKMLNRVSAGDERWARAVGITKRLKKERKGHMTTLGHTQKKFYFSAFGLSFVSFWAFRCSPSRAARVWEFIFIKYEYMQYGRLDHVHNECFNWIQSDTDAHLLYFFFQQKYLMTRMLIADSFALLLLRRTRKEWTK